MRNLRPLIISILLILLSCGCSQSAENPSKIFKGKLAFSSTRYMLDDRYKSGGVCVLKDGKVAFVSKAAQPAWSPDGQLLVIAHVDNTLHIIKDDGAVVEKIQTLMRAHYPQWHPTENKIFYVEDEEIDIKYANLKYRPGEHTKKIYMYNMDKKESTLIFYDKNKGYDIVSMYVSPDGKYLAFRVTAAFSSSYPATLTLNGAYVIDIAGKNLQLVDKNGLPQGWFPDGKNLCYGANIGEDGNLLTSVGSTAGYLFKYNIETKIKEIVGKDALSSFSKLSRDGKYLYFSSGAGIWVGPIEDVTKSELIVPSVVINPKNDNRSQEFESDWFQGE